MKSTPRISFFIFSILVLNLFTACCDEDVVEDPTEIDCAFEQNDDDMDGLIDDTENQIMEDCRNNKILDRDKIKSNLIGSWELVGHGEGWVANISQPCGKVTFTESEFIFVFKSSYADTVYTRKWDIIETESGGVFFEIIGDPIYELNMSVFCDDYMFFDHTPLDGNMYIYEKNK